MENLEWYPVFYNGNETNFMVTKCAKVKRIKVDWLKKDFKNYGEIDFNLKKKHPQGYLYVKIQIKNIGRKTLHVHQLIASAFLGYKWNGHFLVIDHINSNKEDNRLENLRLITNRENCIKDKFKLSGLPTGVYFYKRTKKYYSKIVINYKQIHLGYFESIDLASFAYQNKLKQL